MFNISERSIRASVCKKSFYEFFKMAWPLVVAEELVKNWHIQFLCNELQAVAERVFAGQPKLYDLVINISPGSSKSTIVSQVFPAWCFTRMPSFRSINASHTQSLAMKDSLACRDIVTSDFYREHFPYAADLREDENMKGLFRNKSKGGRRAASVGSKITGFHAHILSVDDPIDPEASLSETEMKKVNRWMFSTLPSRGIMRTDTPIILVMQRLAQNDPSGERLIKGGRVKHICIPAELVYDKEGHIAVNVQPPELVRHYRQRLMDPARLNREHLTEFRKTLGEYGYAGQFLQDPVPLTGAMFDIPQLAIDRVAPPRFVRMIRAWDKAATKDAGAFSAGVLMALDKHGDYWVLDVVRGQWTPTQRESMIKQTAAVDRSGAHGCLIGGSTTNVAVEIIVEKEGGSGGVESTDNTIRNLSGHRVSGKRVTGKKEERAWAFASQCGVKDHVHLLERPWMHEYREELRFFPHSKYKDQVDGSSLAFNRMAKPQRIVGAGVLNRK